MTKTAAPRRTPEQITELVRIVLESPPDESHESVAARTGYGREWVRRIRTGEKCADLFPELPRIITGQRLCTRCEHWVAKEFRYQGFRRTGICDLGIPEAVEIGCRYGIGCGAFAQKKGTNQ